MNLILFSDLKANRGIQTMAGKCPTSPDFADYCNSAVRMLMRRGDWFSLASARFCTYESCVAWPSFVGRVRAVNVCRNPVPVMGAWYEFLQFGRGTRTTGCCVSGDATVVNRGRVPVFHNIACGQSRYIRAYPRVLADIGKTLTFYGVDANGNTVRTKTGDLWTDGMTVTLAAPYASTSTTFSRVDRVRKEATQGDVDVFQYDATNDVLLEMAHYLPNDTEPAYVQSLIGGHGCGTSCNGIRQVDVLFKMSEVPMVNDGDICQIQNIEAIKTMILAVKKAEAGDPQAAIAEEFRAVKEMNLQSADEFPDDQVPVTVAPFGTALPSNAHIGRMV
jgi:hypothetical protein